jgi:hypothetical protein
MDAHPASGAPDLFEVISLVCDGLRRRAGARP